MKSESYRLSGKEPVGRHGLKLQISQIAVGVKQCKRDYCHHDTADDQHEVVLIVYTQQKQTDNT